MIHRNKEEGRGRASSKGKIAIDYNCSGLELNIKSNYLETFYDLRIVWHCKVLVFLFLQLAENAKAMEEMEQKWADRLEEAEKKNKVRCVLDNSLNDQKYRKQDSKYKNDRRMPAINLIGTIDQIYDY